MESIIFINPTDNLSLVSNILLIKHGIPVKKIRTSDYDNVIARNFIYSYIGNFGFIDIGGNVEAKSRFVNTLKKPMFKMFEVMNRGKVELFDTPLDNYTHEDYVLLSSSFWKDTPSSQNDFEFFDGTALDVMGQYSSSIIAYSSLRSQNAKTFVTTWETKYNIQNTLSEDYFFIFDNNGRHDMYVSDGKLITISDQNPTVEWVSSLNYAFKKFNFKNVNCYRTERNQQSWVVNNSKFLFLINSYSFANYSSLMPKSWAENLAKILASAYKNKNRKWFWSRKSLS